MENLENFKKKCRIKNFFLKSGKLGLFYLIVTALPLIFILGSAFFSLGNLVPKWFFCPTQAETNDTVNITASVELTIQPACHDGIDNDSDGLRDYPDDPGCDDIYDTDEYNLPACSDGLDNDGDGLIDYPNDPGCLSSSDTNEYNVPSPPAVGGGFLPPPPQTMVILRGKAYPLTRVNVLKDGQLTTTVNADSNANFEVQLTDVTAGVHTFGVWAEDKNKKKSLTFNFTANIISGMTTTISGILLPPTIDINKNQLTWGEILNILGQTAPQSEISIVINSAQEIIKKTKAENDGTWFYAFNTAEVEEGSHSTKAKSEHPEGLTSIFSQALSFWVGGGATPTPEEKCPRPADINRDGKVNLVDFSILLYNWGSPKNKNADLNCDNRVNLTDFSIMMFWWTG